jgi:hypothetical protein
MVFTSCGYVQLEQHRNRRVDPTKGVVVHDRAHQTSVFGQRTGLRLDGLSCQDAADRRQERVTVQEVHIARKLLDGFEAGNPLDLYSPVPSVCQTVFCSVLFARSYALRSRTSTLKAALVSVPTVCICCARACRLPSSNCLLVCRSSFTGKPSCGTRS